MIDRPARRQLAQALRHFVAGVIGQNEFENRIPRGSKDIAVNEIAAESWGLYSDYEEDYWLVGKNKLDSKARKIVLKWILFLYTDLEYERRPQYWIILNIIFVILLFGLCFVSTVTYSLLGLVVYFIVRPIVTMKYRLREDEKHWPFSNESTFLAALKRPVFLTGKTLYKKQS